MATKNRPPVLPSAATRTTACLTLRPELAARVIDTLSFTIPIEPIGKQSHAPMRRHDGIVPTVTLTTKGKTRSHMQRLTLALTQHRPPAPWMGPVVVEVIFRMQVPPSYRGRVEQLACKEKHPDEILHARKPDVDNMSKMLCDALTRAGYWGDDSQMCLLVAEKTWSRRVGYDVTLRHLATSGKHDTSVKTSAPRLKGIG